MPVRFANATIYNGTSTIRLGDAGQYYTHSGVGIRFPTDWATTKSADVNTLDDYEEGTFNASISGSGGPNITGQYSTYLKVGRLVTVNISMLIRRSTASGNQTVINLPFPGSNASGYYQAVGTGGWSNFATNIINLYCAVPNGSTTLVVYRLTGAQSSPTQLQGEDWQTGSDTYMQFTVTYLTD